MRLRAVLICAFSVLCAPLGTWAATPLLWSELPDPSVQDFHDPFRALSPEQFDDLVYVLRLRSRLQQDVGTAEERQMWQQNLFETEDALAAEKIDIDRLLSQRDNVIAQRAKAGSQGNPDLEGKAATIQGYAIPAPQAPNGASIIYLVPRPGMCSHLPPPPPNQMIRVELETDWMPEYIHQSVEVTGRLTISPSNTQFVVVDGPVAMRATFLLSDAIVTQADVADSATQTFKDRLRAASRNKTGGAVLSNEN